MIEMSYVVAGALTGLLVGMTGVGGGALMTPVLVLFFGVHPSVAVATDLWFAAISKSVGALIHHRSGQVDWQVIRRLWLGSLPTAGLVVFWLSHGHSDLNVDWLNQAIGFVILLTAIGLIVAPRLYAVAFRCRLSQPVGFKMAQPMLTTFAGGVLGVFVTLTSVGAGALGSVMLLFLYPLRMKPHRLVATDIVHAIPLAVVGGLGYWFAGMVNTEILLSMLVGSVPAIALGSLIARGISGRFIQLFLALVLCAAGIKLLAS